MTRRTNLQVWTLVTLAATAFATQTATAKELHTMDKIVFDWTRLNAQAQEEALKPIRPGVPGEAPFWNVHARQFTYVPAFDFKPVEGATAYRFDCTVAATGKKFSCTLPRPYDPIVPLWKELPQASTVDLKVLALDAQGTVIKEVGSRAFMRWAWFHGPYTPGKNAYADCCFKSLRHVFKESYVQELGRTGVPDVGKYRYFCYPSKMLSAIVSGLCVYAANAPDDREKALQIARKAADWLIGASLPAGTPFEYLPPTYLGENATAKDRNHVLMMIYPIDVAKSYLYLYEAVHDAKYLKAAERIVATYRRLQTPAGSWPLLCDSRAGKPLGGNVIVPDTYLFLCDMLEKAGSDAAGDSKARALAWLQENPLKTFNWEGQFEDTSASERYRNLSKGQACSVARYLLAHRKDAPSYLKQAEELLRYAEDQFVMWEDCVVPPARMVEMFGKKETVGRRGGSLYPCALEQYGWMMPIGASASDLIGGWAKMYEATGDRLWLAKAMALGDSMTRSQHPDGFLPTYWYNGASGGDDWLNCEIVSAVTMNDLDAACDAEAVQK